MKFIYYCFKKEFHGSCYNILYETEALTLSLLEMALSQFKQKHH